MSRNSGTLPPTALDELRRDLERLGLRAVLAGLDDALDEAARLEQGYATFLAGLIAREVLARGDAAAERRLKAAGFPEVKTFDTFDWAFQPGLNVQQAKDLMNLQFIRDGRPLLLLGKPGTGKTHLSLAYGVLAAQRGFTVRFYTAQRLLAELYASLADDTAARLIARLARVDLLVIDDLRHIPPRADYAPLLFDLVEARYQRKPILLSSNLSVKQWGTVLGNPVLTASMVDRLMDRAHVLNIRRGRSYRTEGPGAPPEADRPEGLAPPDPDDA
jgi:DNA replication protein DnaC